MTFKQIEKFITKNIRYKDWEFHVKKKGPVIYLQIQFMAPESFQFFNPDGGDLGRNSNSRFTERQYCRKWLLSTHMTPSEIVGTCHTAVIQAEIHEISENFRYKGTLVFNCHRDVEALKEIVHRSDVRK